MLCEAGISVFRALVPDVDKGCQVWSRWTRRCAKSLEIVLLGTIGLYMANISFLGVERLAFRDWLLGLVFNNSAAFRFADAYQRLILCN